MLIFSWVAQQIRVANHIHHRSWKILTHGTIKYNNCLLVHENDETMRNK